MEKEIVLKKAIIGGFDRNEVINCIAMLQEEAFSNKSDNAEIRHLRSKIDELEMLVAQRDAEIERLSAEIKAAESSLRVSKTSAKLMRESVEYADCYVESAKVIADEISEKTCESIGSAKEKVSSLLLDITGISDDVLALYTSLAELKSEYDSFMDPSENYLAEDEKTTVVDGGEPQAGPLDEEQSEPAVPHQGVEEARELIRSVREKYKQFM